MQTSYKDTAYSYIKTRIINGILAPGDIIDEKKFIAELGVSRTPIREALSRLSEEGLITIIPRKGMVVSHVAVKDILDIYEARKALEPFIIGLLSGKVDRKRLEEFRNEFRDTDMISSTSAGRDLDGEFHMYLVDCTDNRYLVKIEEQLITQSQRIRVLSSAYDSNGDLGARQEHIRMIDCLLQDDITGARKVCREHIAKSIERYKKIFSNKSYFSL